MTTPVPSQSSEAGTADEDGRSGRGMTRRATRAFGWAVLSFGGRRLVNFLGTLILARILVPADFGLVAAGVTLLTFMEMALDMGVGSAVVYEQEEGISDRVHTAFLLNLALGVGLTVLGVLAAPWIAGFFQAPDEADLFRVMFLYLLAKAAGQVPDALLRRDLAFRRRMTAEITRALMKVGVAIPLALAGFGAWSIVVGMIASELAGTLVTWVAARFRPRFRVDGPAVRALITYGSTMLGVRLVAELAGNADYLIVGNRLGPDQLGVYSIAYRAPELVLATVFWLYSMVAFPVYSRTGATDPGRLKGAMLRATRLTTLFAFPAGVGMALVAHDAIHVLFTDRWAQAVVPMTLIALSFAVRSVSVASGDVLPSIGRPGVLLRVNLVLLVPTLGVMVLVAPFGITAVAAVQLVSSLVFVPLLQFEVNRAVGARASEVLSALAPAASAALGIALTVTPVLLLIDAGLVRLVVSVVVGVLGAGLGLVTGGRAALPEIRGLSAHLTRG